MAIHNSGDIILASVHEGLSLYAEKSADQGVTSSTVLVDCTDLTVSLLANAKYFFVGYIFYTAPTDNVPDIKVQWVNPAGSTHTQFPEGVALTVTGSNPLAWNALLAVGFSEVVVGAGSTSSVQCLRVSGVITTAGTAGASKVQFAQNTSSANTTTVKAKSFLKYERVA